MRIISKFKDYYDGVQYYGQDLELVYVRDKYYPDEYIDMKKYLDLSYHKEIVYPSLESEYEKNVELKFNGSFILGFCGKLYRGFVVEIVTQDTYKIENKTSKFVVCYNEKMFEPYKFNDTKKHKKDRYIGWYRNRGYNKEVDVWKIENQKELQEIFFKYKTPCFIISEGSIRKQQGNGCNSFKTNLTINPELNKYQFYRIQDAYTTFQDISMYISGVLGIGAPVTVDISNKSMAVKKGFGHKYAFRKEPENKDNIK